jgi:hypothetical protein
MMGASTNRWMSANRSTTDHSQVRLIKADQPSRSWVSRLAAVAGAARWRGHGARAAALRVEREGDGDRDHRTAG